MSKVYDILRQIADTPSINEKEAILRANEGNVTLKRVFEYAYHGKILFWIKSLDMAFGTEEPSTPLDLALDELRDNICNRRVTGGAAKKFIDDLLVSMSHEDADVLRRVILKDLRCGATATLANRVWKELIPKQKFMLAETDPSRIVYPAISQIKEDGARVAMTFDGAKAAFTTRNGSEVETHGVFDEWASTIILPGDVVDGELVVFRDGKVLDRKTGNGIVNKAIKGTISKEEACNLFFKVWDLIPASDTKGDTSYITRLGLLNAAIADRIGGPYMGEVVEYRIVRNYEEALSHFREERRKGNEGTILKNAGAKWQGKRTYDMVKFKAEIVGDFKVTGFEYGTGKHAKRVGNLLCESECGAVKFAVGIFKDMDEDVRDYLLEPDGMPPVVSVLYNERISRRGEEAESLFLPRVVELRYDKFDANTREDLIALEAAAIAE